ncbi:hypothetical protein [Campylobacter concisus]|uniref:hypothetical protein n=1 Tax=Campylobacter concisus TaxID=199 RepID=UPI000CD88010|nr:hypothetical protein [Campylobacter concisus]
MGYFNIEFLRRPELSPLSPKAGYAVGLGAVANGVKDIADIGLNRQKLDDDNKRYQEEKLFRNDELNFRKNSHAETMKARGDELAYQKDKDEKDRIFNEKKLSIDELRANRDREVDWYKAKSLNGYYNYLTQRGGEETGGSQKANYYREILKDELKDKFGDDWVKLSDKDVINFGNVQTAIRREQGGSDTEVVVDESTAKFLYPTGRVRQGNDGRFYAPAAAVNQLTKDRNERKAKIDAMSPELLRKEVRKKLWEQTGDLAESNRLYRERSAKNPNFAKDYLLDGAL